MISDMTLFEGFISYCEQDNKPLARDIRTWLADYIDLPNRTIPLLNSEIAWITDNLSEDNQRKILGYTVSEYIKRSNYDN